MASIWERCWKWTPLMAAEGYLATYNICISTLEQIRWEFSILRYKYEIIQTRCLKVLCVSPLASSTSVTSQTGTSPIITLGFFSFFFLPGIRNVAHSWHFSFGSQNEMQLILLKLLRFKVMGKKSRFVATGHHKDYGWAEMHVCSIK